MKNPTSLPLLAAGLVAVAANWPEQIHAQHEHINAGAVSKDSGSALLFDGASSFILSSGYVFGMSFRNIGDYYAGYYVHDELTFTALAATPWNGGPEALSAAIGTNLSLQIVSVSGPAGGSFGFWEPDALVTPTVSLPSGSVESTPGGGLFTFVLTEAFPDDPFGHIHDRAFSANMPGTYDVSFRIVDTTNYHTPSELYAFRFEAVPEPSVWILISLGVLGIFGMFRRRSQQH